MIKVGSALLEYAEQLERERGIPKALILDSLKEAMVAAYRRYAKLSDGQGLSCRLIEQTGEIGIYEHKLVVDELREPEPEPEPELDEEGNPILVEAQAPADEVMGEGAYSQTVAETAEPTDEEMALGHEPQDALDALQGEAVEPEQSEPVEEEAEQEPEEPRLPPIHRQILLNDARKIKPDIQLGDELLIDVTPSEFGRIAAESAKQVIKQRIREAEKLLILDEFEQKKNTVVPGMVQRIEGPNVIISIGRSEAIMPRREQLHGEYYRVGNRLRVYVLDVRDSGRVPQIIVSQAHPAMVREVFELEVPEIEDGLVEIKGIAREAGFRTKVAVHSNDPDVDPQGACIGTRGSRIQSIVNELRNEKIDIIRWSENPMEFIINALAPARIADVRLDPNPDNRRALVVVPDDQLSLAIGREGQNVRLAAKLTGYKLDIKSQSQFFRLRDRLLERRHAELEAAAEAYDGDDEESVGYAHQDEGAGLEPAESLMAVAAGLPTTEEVERYDEAMATSVDGGAQATSVTFAGVEDSPVDELEQAQPFEHSLDNELTDEAKYLAMPGELKSGEVES